MTQFQPHDELFADRRLERRIVIFLVNHGRADLCKLHIQARGGVVRLRGQVATNADRNYVVQGARRVAGVIDVEDNIEVSLLPTQSAFVATKTGSPQHAPPIQPLVLRSA